MKIGILRESKIPIDNRVPLTPLQVKFLQDNYECKFVVQSSDFRIYPDKEYQNFGIEVREDISDCDCFLGIKEQQPNLLIPNKTYMFFGHIAKLQPYNKSLYLAMRDKNITFVDYEYIRDSASLRTCAFGWWAGVVGTYNTIRLYCLKYNLCNLNKLDYHYSINELMAQIEIAKKALSNSNIRVVVTGNGKVSKGCQFILDKVSIPRLSVKDYLNVNECQKCYCVAETKDLVKRKDNGLYNRCDFHAQPSEYESLFILFAKRSNTFISCHEWEPNMPVYFDEYCMNHGKIRVVGDITCDINGSVKSTVRSSTHDNPFYDFSYEMMKEVPLFDDKDSISVMAVDTCPNSLAREASENFGSQIIINAIIPIIQDQFVDNVFNKAVLIRKGVPTSYFKYLNEYESINKENN